MLFVTLNRFKPGKEQEGAARRLQWQYPEGVRVLAEYWLQTNDPAVIIVFEADDIAPIMAVSAAWMDVFDTTTVPAISAEDGVSLLQQMIQNGAFQ